MPSLPPDLPDAFTVTADGGGGLSRARVRSLPLGAPSRGARVRADAQDPLHATIVATLAVVRPGSIVCGATAARLWRLPLPPWIALDEEPAIHVAAGPEGAHAERTGVRGRRLVLPVEHVTVVDGLPVTTPARTWLDCAADIPLPHVVAMGDAVLRRRLAHERELDAMLHWGFRRRGVGVARRARPLLDERAESPGESWIRTELVLAGLPRPICNPDIHDSGEWLARADLAWPDQMVIVEYDGRVHITEEARRFDARRRNLLQDAGWLVVVVTADDLRRPWLIVATVRRALTTPHRAATRG
ncbi:MAG: hypothetical protein U0R65_14055 [Candidatus Nanopelagicales bacterium]